MDKPGPPGCGPRRVARMESVHWRFEDVKVVLEFGLNHAQHLRSPVPRLSTRSWPGALTTWPVELVWHVCGTSGPEMSSRFLSATRKPRLTRAFLRGRWWDRTTDLRLVRAEAADLVTWGNASKCQLTSGSECSSFSNVAHRFASLRGTVAGPRSGVRVVTEVTTREAPWQRSVYGS